jgi:hypothetical protein
MDRIAKAKLGPELSGKLGPILGQGIADPVGYLGVAGKYPDWRQDEKDAPKPNGLGVAQDGGEHQVKDPSEGHIPFDMDMESIPMPQGYGMMHTGGSNVPEDPALMAKKAWEDTLDDVRKGLDAWTPEFGTSLAKSRKRPFIPSNPNIKGVHPQQGQLGMSPAGYYQGDKSSKHSQEKAKQIHRQVLSEMRSMPKPALKSDAQNYKVEQPVGMALKPIDDQRNVAFRPSPPDKIKYPNLPLGQKKN